MEPGMFFIRMARITMSVVLLCVGRYEFCRTSKGEGIFRSGTQRVGMEKNPFGRQCLDILPEDQSRCQQNPEDKHVARGLPQDAIQLLSLSDAYHPAPGQHMGNHVEQGK